MIDHIDIITTHKCNSQCPHCIDPLRNKSNKEIDAGVINRFLAELQAKIQKKATVLLLGGEPMLLSKQKLIEICDIIHKNGFRASISTTHQYYKKINKLYDYFDTIQVTIDEPLDATYFYPLSDKINIKMPIKEDTTPLILREFQRISKYFYRASLPVYFNSQTWNSLCTNANIIKELTKLKWQRNGSYSYAFKDGIRYKKCIPLETNIIDEPQIPKLYPNGNYNKTWLNEYNDNYLQLEGW